jgi:hypothetical protein
LFSKEWYKIPINYIVKFRVVEVKKSNKLRTNFCVVSQSYTFSGR